jgi:hypothetical protein
VHQSLLIAFILHEYFELAEIARFPVAQIGFLNHGGSNNPPTQFGPVCESDALDSVRRLPEKAACSWFLCSLGGGLGNARMSRAPSIFLIRQCRKSGSDRVIRQIVAENGEFT